jgi:hypothetical protein
MNGTPQASRSMVTPSRGVSVETTSSGSKPAGLNSRSTSARVIASGSTSVSASYSSSWSAKLVGFSGSATRSGPTPGRSSAVTVPLEPGGRMFHTVP